MGAAVRNDTVPETGRGAWCWTGESEPPIRRIPRLDRVLGEGKGFGIRGGAFMLSQGFPSVRSQMRPYHTQVVHSINSAPSQWRLVAQRWTGRTGTWTLLGLAPWSAFLRQDLLEAFPGFSTVSSPHPSVPSPLAWPWRLCTSLLSVAPSPAFGLTCLRATGRHPFVTACKRPSDSKLGSVTVPTCKLESIPSIEDVLTE
ncbi:hypothetical protein V8C26DRAFT_252283 [Trichoderma gracile]